MTSITTYWSPKRKDHFAVVSYLDRLSAEAAGYRMVRGECQIWRTQEPNTVPLRLFYSDERGDNFTTATEAGVRDALAAGYREVDRVEGYVWQTKTAPDQVPLIQYWHAGRGDNFLVSHEDSEAAAIGAGYVRVRVEGYVKHIKYL